jgi:hypothetical protein
LKKKQCKLLFRHTLRPGIWKQYVPPKRRWIFAGLQSVTSYLLWYPHIRHISFLLILVFVPFWAAYLQFPLSSAFLVAIFQIFIFHNGLRGTRWRSRLTYYATSRKVAGSIPDEVIRYICWPNPSSRITALSLTQALTEVSARNLTGGKGRPAGV